MLNDLDAFMRPNLSHFFGYLKQVLGKREE